MNYQAAMFYLTLVMTIVNIIIGLTVWWTSRDKITNTRFKALEDKMISFDSEIKHRPDCQYHQGFENRLDKVNGGINKIEGRMEGIGEALNMIQQFLINGGKG